MTKYVLTVERIRVLKYDEQRRVTDRQSFNKGDVVEGIDDYRLKQLLDAGAVAEQGSEDAEQAQGDAGSPADGEGQETPVEGQDKYDAMSYSDLQSEAKSRDINAGGSAEDLRERLRAFDEDEAANA